MISVHLKGAINLQTSVWVKLYIKLFLFVFAESEDEGLTLIIYSSSGMKQVNSITAESIFIKASIIQTFSDY